MISPERLHELADVTRIVLEIEGPREIWYLQEVK